MSNLFLSLYDKLSDFDKRKFYNYYLEKKLFGYNFLVFFLTLVPKWKTIIKRFQNYILTPEVFGSFYNQIYRGRPPGGK